MKREEFTKARFILAEGFEDSAFATTLARTTSRHLPEFDISPNDHLGSIAGNGGFENAAIGASGLRGFDAITDVVILSDNDDDPDALFQKVRGQIEKAKREGNLRRDWGVPDEPGVKADGEPSLSIWMWPEPGTPGCLETLLWRVIERKYADKAHCVEAALRCTEADQWPVHKQDKARVRAFLALHCKRNPVVRFDVLWRDCPNLIPMNDRVFSPFANFLRAIRAS